MLLARCECALAVLVPTCPLRADGVLTALWLAILWLRRPHDPVRDFSDMLAWLHQCVASEKEQLLVLLAKSSTDAEITGRPRISQLPEADKEMLHTALNKALEGACRPLQARIEQVLMGQPKVVVCYQLANLLQFYGATIQELVEFLPSLVAVLSELHALALKMFFDRLNIHANQLLVDVEPPPDDLAAPSEVEKALGKRHGCLH